jgi:hypothetical protein
MIRLCTGAFLWLALSLSAAAGTLPVPGTLGRWRDWAAKPDGVTDRDQLRVQRHENGGRIRFLRDEEEDRIRNSITKLFPEHQDELTISIGTGMRLSEQYGLIWR